MTDRDWIKQREIIMAELHPEADQADSVVQLLQGASGMLEVSRNGNRISIKYDLHELSLQSIESALVELGFHLDNNLLSKIKRALYYYTEEVQRENLGVTPDQKSNTRSVFINRYERLQHGCRDKTPKLWRKYL